MKADVRTFVLVVKETAAYRSNTVASFFVTMIPIIFLIVFWEAAYSSVQLIAGYTKSQLISYYFAVLLLQDLIVPFVNYEIVNDIRSGKLASYIVRPYHYLRHCLAVRLAVSFNTLLHTALIIIPIVILGFKDSVVVPENIVYIIIIIVNAYIITLLLSTLLSLVSFWMENVSAIDGGLNLIIPFASGAVLPLSFFPDWLVMYLDKLPFRYTLALATESLTNSISTTSIKSGIVHQVVYIGMLCIILLLVWTNGKKKFTAYGA